MDKDKLITDIIANEGTRFGEDDRKFLEAQEIKALEKFVPPEKKAEPTVNDEVKTKADDKPAEKKPADDVTANEPKTVEEYIDNAPGPLKEVMEDQLLSYETDKKRLINTITANGRNTFTAEQLEPMRLQQLQSIARLAVTEEQEQQQKNPIYLGQGDLADNTADMGDLPIPKAVVNAEPAKKE